MPPADRFQLHSESLTTSLARIKPATPSASDLEFLPRAIGCTADGTATIVTQLDGEPETTADVKLIAGKEHPYRPTKITAFDGSGLWIGD